MDWVQFVIQWLHVFFGIFWFGAVLYGDFILIPALVTLPVRGQREFGGVVGDRADRVIPVVAGLVILLGLIRGTVFGPIKGLDALTTQYGLTWLVALIAALATFAWGYWVIKPGVDRLNAIPVDEAVGADGTPAPALVAQLDKVKRDAMLELIGFFVIFTCMILMRFGL